MKIQGVGVREVFDSRSEVTIEVALKIGGRGFRAPVPSGRSRGKKEAAVFDFPEARRSAAWVQRKMNRKGFTNLKTLDQFLIDLDGTKNKARLGGNVALGISTAFAGALAHQKKKEIWQILKEEFFHGKLERRPPFIFSNLINGGAHTDNNLDIQEYMVIVKSEKRMGKSVQNLIKFYKRLGELLEARYKKKLPLGDEGGYTLNFRSNFEPIAVLENLIRRYRLQKNFSIGLDAAADSFWKKGRYNFEGRRISGRTLGKTYMGYFDKSELLYSIEDPFYEGDYENFARLRKGLRGKLVVGDDLTATNPALIRKFGEKELINAVIIKPNQIGTVSEACEALKTAKKLGLKTIVSHRSGETEDNFIIHLAKASSAYSLKIGAPARERIAKFNELIRIYSRQ